MELINVTGYPVQGKLITYPAGACLVLKDIFMDEKLILKMDDDGFGRLAKFLASHLTDNAMEETKIHGFRVSMSADRLLRVEGSIIPKVGEKFKGDIYLPIGDQLEELVCMMSAMDGDGHVLWTSDEAECQLRLMLSHKRGLELNVAMSGKEVSSIRLVFVPEEVFFALANLKLMNFMFAVSCQVSNPWYETQIIFAPLGDSVEVNIFGHLAGGNKTKVVVSVEQLDTLQKMIQGYFWG